MGGSLLGAVATWPPANYTNPPTRGDGIIIASGLFGGLGAMTTLMRIYTRLYITRTFGADDGLIILALVGMSIRERNPQTDQIMDSRSYP
jgi:hypothetical protein